MGIFLPLSTQALHILSNKQKSQTALPHLFVCDFIAAWPPKQMLMAAKKACFNARASVQSFVC